MSVAAQNPRVAAALASGGRSPAPVTMVTIPKGFRDHAGVIQTNAVHSWTKLVRPEQVILCGDDPGVREMAEATGAVHRPDIQKTDLGTPLVSDAILRTAREATTPWVCYLNGDIILDSSFGRLLDRIDTERPTLLVGRRIDVDVTEVLDLDHDDAERQLAAIAATGKLSPSNAIDFFCFTPGRWVQNMPEFAVGRPGWDNWFMFNAVRRGVRVIDVTGQMLTLHQNHGYGHVPKGTGVAWNGPEAERHRQIIGSWFCYFTIDDATHVLTPKGVRRAMARTAWKSRWKRFRLRTTWRHLIPENMRDERESIEILPPGWVRTKVRLERAFFSLFIAVVLVPLRLVKRAVHAVWWPLRVRVLRPIKRAIFGRKAEAAAGTQEDQETMRGA
ncbi:MAG: hypothetical protein K2Y21_11375 [Phycisphaerales bacterium]|nr:hypothetical protein [Phycisphaerales bacterium]